MNTHGLFNKRTFGLIFAKFLSSSSLWSNRKSERGGKTKFCTGRKVSPMNTWRMMADCSLMMLSQTIERGKLNEAQTKVEEWAEDGI